MMSNRLLVAVFIAAAMAVLANAQNAETNPAHAPDVYLDNHRPLIQKKGKPPTARTVSGKVVDDTGQPLSGAIVTLTNTKTNDKKQVITKAGGRYNFEDVSFDIDYELRARYKTSLSDVRKLSQYDRMSSVVRILQIDPNSPGAEAEAKKETPPETKK
jgi:carboxypeptidase family protein